MVSRSVNRTPRRREVLLPDAGVAHMISDEIVQGGEGGWEDRQTTKTLIQGCIMTDSGVCVCV